MKLNFLLFHCGRLRISPLLYLTTAIAATIWFSANIGQATGIDAGYLQDQNAFLKMARVRLSPFVGFGRKGTGRKDWEDGLSVDMQPAPASSEKTLWQKEVMPSKQSCPEIISLSKGRGGESHGEGTGLKTERSMVASVNHEVGEDDDDGSQQQQPNPDLVPDSLVTAYSFSSSLFMPVHILFLLLGCFGFWKADSCGGNFKPRSGQKSSQFSSSFPKKGALLKFLLFSTMLCVGGDCVRFSGDCGVECWLQDLVINIPDQDIESHGYKFDIKGLTCKGVQLEGIDSDFHPPLEVSYALKGLGTSCTTNWEFHEIKWPHVSGSGDATVSVSSSSAAFDIQLQQAPDGLADAALLANCKTDIQISNIQVSGAMGVVVTVFKGIIKSVIQNKLDATICTSLTVAVESNLTAVLRDIDKEIRPYMHPVAPGQVVNITNNKDWVPLDHNGVLGVADFVLDTVVGSNGPWSLNFFADRFTNNTGRLSLGQLLSLLNISVPAVNIPISTLGNVSVGIIDAHVQGLNTWKHFDVLRPVGGEVVTSQSTLDHLFINITFFVNVTTGHDTIRSGGSLYEIGRIILDLDNSSLSMDSVLGIKSGILGSLAGNQFMCIPCVLQAIQTVNTSYMWFNMSVTELKVEALTDASDQLALDIDNAIDTLLNLFTESFGPAIPAFLSGMASGPAQRYVNEAVNTEMKTLKNSGPCISPQDDDYVGTNSSVLLISFTAVAVMFMVLVVLQYCFGGPTSSSSRSRTESHVPDLEETFLFKPSQSPCLFLHPDVHVTARLIVPLIIMGNIALFLTSNTSKGAGVAMYLNAEGGFVRLPSLFDFTLSNSVHDMWDAGVYPLSILIAVFSGAWPYAKLSLLLFAWFLPSRFLSDRKREFFLMVLDAMGKWSMIDAYVLILMTVAFDFHLQVPSTIPHPAAADSVSLDVHVMAEFGFYTFMAATILSLLLTHVVLAFHRRATSSARRKQLDRIEERGKAEPLCLHAFRVRGHRVRCTLLGRVLVAVLVVASLGLMAWGAYRPSFTFEFLGLLAVVLNYIGEPSSQEYSIISLGTTLSSTAPASHIAGVTSIQIIYFTFVLVMPLLLMLSLIVLWLVPMKPRTQRRLYVMTEIFNAWAGLEVFVVSIAAALLEIRQFAQFVIGTKCDLINTILVKYFDSELNGNDRCFDVIATLASGCWILFSSCIIYLSVAALMIRLCHKVLEEREDKAFSMPLTAGNGAASPEVSSNTDVSSSAGSDTATDTKFGFISRLFVERYEHHPLN